MSKEKELIKTSGELVASSSFEEVANRLHALSTKLDIKPFNRMFVLAEAINELRAALIDDVMKPIMNLQSSRIGFKTDKDVIKNKDTNWKPVKGPGYEMDIVRDVTIEAILYGAYMTGNEVNIISGQMYATKEHFVRKVRELDGLTDLNVQIGTPVIEREAGKDNGSAVAKIRCKARWKMHGVEQSVGMDDAVPLVFSTRVYDRDGGQSVASDMAAGKVTRKLYKLIFETATGSKITIPDGDASEVARDVDIKVVDRATVNLDDIKPGDADTHTAVDAPVMGKKQPVADTDFAAALGKLSLHYDGNEKRIDGALSKAGLDVELFDIKPDCADENIRRAVVEIAKGF